jgi:hypothetical protein
MTRARERKVRALFTAMRLGCASDDEEFATSRDLFTILIKKRQFTNCFFALAARCALCTLATSDKKCNDTFITKEFYLPDTMTMIRNTNLTVGDLDGRHQQPTSPCR